MTISLATLLLPALLLAQEPGKRYPGGLDWRQDAEGLSWTSTAEDVFRFRNFRLEFGRDFVLSSNGGADVVFGHHRGNAVWAVVFLDEPATISAIDQPGDGDTTQEIWMRFHPSRVKELFRARVTDGPGDPRHLARARAIYRHKIQYKWCTPSNRPVIVPSGALVFDADTLEGKRRAYLLTSGDRKVTYEARFENEPTPTSAPIEPPDAMRIFDEVWGAFDKEYAMFTTLPDLDWDEVKERYRPMAEEASTVLELGNVLSLLVGELRDLHAWVQAEGTHLPGYDPERPENMSGRNLRAQVGELKTIQPNVSWTRLDKGYGYIALWSLSGKGLDTAFDSALELLEDSPGLVLDLRFNGGGDELLGRRIAGRFLEEPYTYSASRYRSGPGRDELGPPQDRVCEPRTDTWCYDRPVAVLQGPRTMSSAESLLYMLKGAKQVRTYGDFTAGSSGNPRQLKFECGITVNLPRWLDLGPEGEVLERVGIEPDVEVEVELKDLEKGDDPVLEKAEKDLRKRR